MEETTIEFRITPLGFVALAVLVFALLSSCHAQVASGGQQGVYTNTVQIADHPQHADQHDLRQEVSLLGSNGVSSAHGERPLWEFGSEKAETPLGDVARYYRKLALYGTEKARIRWEKQGE
jgi:hypothetical protein